MFVTFTKIIKPKFFSLGFFLYIYSIIKNKQNMNAKKDYSDKISYYRYKVNQAIENLDIEDLNYYTAKLSYFMEREKAARRETLIFGLHPA